MTSFVVNPHFSRAELEKINEIVESGGARSRADFVRMATVYQMKRWNNEQSTE